MRFHKVPENLQALSEEQFNSAARTALQNLPFIFLIVSVPDYRVMYANDAATKLLIRYGVENLDDVVGKQLKEFIPGWEERLLSVHEEVRQKKIIKEIKALCYRLPRGITYWDLVLIPEVDTESGEVVAITVMVTDQTERTLAEDALIQSESMYRTLTETSPDAVVLVSLPDELVLTVNQTALALGGYERADEVVGKSSRNFIPADQWELADQASQELIKTGYLKGLEHLIRRKDNSTFYAEFNASLIRDEDGNPEAYITVLRDISERKEAERLNDALDSINAQISSTLDFDEIMWRVVSLATEAIGVESAVVIMRENGCWVGQYGYGLPQDKRGTCLSDDQMPTALLSARSSEPIVVNDVAREAAIPAIVAELQIKSIMFTPLVVRGELIGTLALQCQSRTVEFNKQQIDFARKLGASLSLALRNAMLFDAERQSRMSLQTAYEYERGIAHTLQRALLPEQPYIGADYEVAAEYLPAYAEQEVGGDFYDIFKTEDDQIGILIGDVSGKGINAASLAGSTRSTVRAFAYELADAPGEALSHANAVLCAQQPQTDLSSPFVTVFLAILDPTTGRLSYATAGHPPPAIYRAHDEVEFLKFGRPPLGIEDKQIYPTELTHLRTGDKIMLYTDGISEAHRGTTMFGMEGIANVFRSYGLQSVDEIRQQLISAINEIVHGELMDDVAVMVISHE